MNIILIGAPGSGKGTQAEKLAQDSSVRHISSGDLFRKAFAEKTELGLKAQTYVDLGELVPDEMTVPMIMSCIEEPGAIQGIVLDGFPRTLAQAQALDAEFQRIHQSIDLVVFINVAREELPGRLSGRLFCQANQHVYHTRFHPPQRAGVCNIDGSSLYQRSDDLGEALRRRLILYFTENNQLLDYYRDQNKFSEIDGNQSIDKVREALLSEIRKHQAKDTKS